MESKSWGDYYLQALNRANELKSRIDECRLEYGPTEEDAQTMIEAIEKVESSDDPQQKDIDQLRWCWLKQFGNCFKMQTREIIYTLLENIKPSAFKEYFSKNEEISHKKKATVKEAYEFLSKVHSKRLKMFLTFVNNDAILFEYIQNKDYDGFFNSLSYTTTGLDELLCFCYEEMNPDYFIINDQFDIETYDETDPESNTGRETEVMDINSLDEMVDIVHAYYNEDLTNLKKSLHVNPPKTIEEDLNQLIELNRGLVGGLYGTGVQKAICTKDYLKALVELCEITHDIGISTEFYRVIIDEWICDPMWMGFVEDAYIFAISLLGFSIQEEIIDRNDPEHVIVVKAKEFLAKHRENNVKNKKGRKKSSWIKTMAECPEEDLGRMFRDEIWPELNKRLKKFTYKDKNDIELRGKDLETAIDALGACFIFYVVDSLGFADRKWSSYEKTTKEFLSVSRNTISSYIEIFDEYDRWLRNDQSNFEVFKSKNPKYYKILVNNFDLFKKTISDLTPRIKKLFEENLTMKSKG